LSVQLLGIRGAVTEKKSNYDNLSLLRIVEDDSQAIPLAGAEAADTMLHRHAGIFAGALHWAVAVGKDYELALFDGDGFAAGLGDADFSCSSNWRLRSTPQR
jgi:hypothetical protein